MTDLPWLPATECPLLRPDGEADAHSLRLVQRLLGILMSHLGTDDVARALLEEIGGAMRADFVAVAEAPRWQSYWQYVRPGTRAPRTLPVSLLSEVLDREAGTGQAPSATGPAYLAAVLSYTERANRVLLIARPREAFDRGELEYAAAAGHYLGAGLERARAWDEQAAAVERLEALVTIARQLAEQRETLPLLKTSRGRRRGCCAATAPASSSGTETARNWSPGRHSGCPTTSCASLMMRASSAACCTRAGRARSMRSRTTRPGTPRLMRGRVSAPAAC